MKRLKKRRFYYWWNVNLIRRRGTFISLFCVAVAFGWLIGLAMGMSFASRVINSQMQYKPTRTDAERIIEEFDLTEIREE